MPPNNSKRKNSSPPKIKPLPSPPPNLSMAKKAPLPNGCSFQKMREREREKGEKKEKKLPSNNKTSSKSSTHSFNGKKGSLQMGVNVSLIKWV
jgi:hypothetical protein